MYCIVENLEDYVYVFKYNVVLYLGIESGSLRLEAGLEYEYEPYRLIQMCV